MKNRIFFTMTLLILHLVLGNFVNAQSGKSSVGIGWKRTAQELRQGRVQIDPEILARVAEAYAAPKDETNDLFGANLTGTWYVTVQGATPELTFYSYQTFGLDGTFVETSSGFATLAESPSHGVWERTKRGNVLTFELFIFDPESRSMTGRIRVRNFVELVSRGHFEAVAAADFIAPDGTVFPNVATFSYTGERVQIRGVE